MLGSKKPNTLQLLKQHVSDLNGQKNEVNRKKSEMIQQKEIAISDVSEKCESLKKSINKSKTIAVRQLNEFYEKQEKLLNEVLANLEARVARAEEELVIDLNGMPMPTVETLSYNFDVTKAKVSIDQLELRPKATTQSPSGETKRSITEESENIKKSSSVAKITATTSDAKYWDMRKLFDRPTPKKPRIVEGQRREHVRDYIKCYKCNKPRCIYREYFLTDEEKIALSKLKVFSKFKASTRYVCGAELPRDPLLTKTLVVESQIDCASVVNWHYFHPKLRNPLICYLCGSSAVSPMSEEEKLAYRVLHKVCMSCQEKGGQPRGQKKTTLADSEYDSDVATAGTP